jgi:ABC-type uncharacterized transport system substrate-binding protein
MSKYKLEFVDSNTCEVFKKWDTASDLKKRQQDLIDELEKVTTELSHLYSEIRQSGLAVHLKKV